MTILSLTRNSLTDVNELQIEESSVNININSSSSNSSTDKKSLYFDSLNVCGLKRRILFPEFSDLANKYDLFCVCETKLDTFDDINLPGYVFLSQCRKQK